ncbi:MAG: 3,4-dihydroxy-2-butanone-4-phosphate synthase, partial [Bacteroidetes bacterium]|nr:3,4-dihydroxy-2-butanone-4-phosphate synthase [Bacteroidota bacterium]
MGKEQPFIQRVKRALEILAKGNMVIVVDDFDRENEGDLLAVAELATPQTLNFMATHARGLICQPLIKQRAEELGLPLMKENATDTHSTAFTISVDHKSCTTGISAYERAGTVKSLVDPNTKPEDLLQPGHVFPLIAKEGGVFSRKGHTEAAVDLARLAGFSPSGVICEIMNDDGTMARLSELKQFASHHNLHIISVEDIIQYRDAIGDVEIIQHSKSFLPTQYGDFTIYAYSSSDPAIGEMVVLENKKKSTADEDHIMQDSEGVPFVRIHSECVTGEAFASLRCDCGPQLQKSFRIIGEKGGVIVYL